ncbi:sensor histidine kinase [Streptomyces sp. NPDC057638]|uniref:sensor histidine kinase n=1 Tax=Streptomyces sp. NPDC057638 TaxID=3346190 RepID=UPI0036B8A21D
MATEYDGSQWRHRAPEHPERPRRTPLALRVPFEGRTWREFGHLMLNLPISIAFFVFAVTTVSLGAGLLITFLGIPVLAAGLAGCRGFGALERARARLLLGHEVAAPEPLRPKNRKLLSWVGAVLKSGPSWRHLLYALVHFPWAVMAFSVSLTLWTLGWSFFLYPLWFWVFRAIGGQPGIQIFGDHDGDAIYLDSFVEVAAAGGAGLAIVWASSWVIRGFAQVDRVMVSGLLGPSSLANRVVELESDRGVVVDTAAADLRRIERDLHDGAQARLVALAMDLGLAKEKLLEDPDAAAAMVDEAHGEIKLALQELRDLARGIHPAVLTDRGLDAALSSIASRCTVPVTVEVDLARRPAPAIEGIAYFTVSELLQNISKHARATKASVDVWYSDGRLMLQVTDNGEGGARASAGSGLAGLTDRLDAVDGILAIDSPVGGPTRVTAELPWRG